MGCAGRDRLGRIGLGVGREGQGRGDVLDVGDRLGEDGRLAGLGDAAERLEKKYAKNGEPNFVLSRKELQALIQRQKTQQRVAA